MQGETFIFFGIFGSGKGTQAGLLMDFLAKNKNSSNVYAGTGEGLRSLLNMGNFSSKVVEKYMLEGKLIPDFLVNSLVVRNLIENLTPDKNLFFDGYPRTLKQAETLFEILSFFEREKINIIYINISREEAEKRNLARGRADDNTETFKKRHEEHTINEIPAMQYLKDKPDVKFYEINGEQPIEKVHQDILKSLKI